MRTRLLSHLENGFFDTHTPNGRKFSDSRSKMIISAVDRALQVVDYIMSQSGVCIFRPDINVMVDWALKINNLFI